MFSIYFNLYVHLQSFWQVRWDSIWSEWKDFWSCHQNLPAWKIPCLSNIWSRKELPLLLHALCSTCRSNGYSILIDVWSDILCFYITSSTFYLSFYFLRNLIKGKFCMLHGIKNRLSCVYNNDSAILLGCSQQQVFISLKAFVGGTQDSRDYRLVHTCYLQICSSLYQNEWGSLKHQSDG